MILAQANLVFSCALQTMPSLIASVTQWIETLCVCVCVCLGAQTELRAQTELPLCPDSGYITTIGVDFRFKTIPVDKKTFGLQVFVGKNMPPSDCAYASPVA